MPPHAGEIEQEHYLAADAETAAPPGIAETRNDGIGVVTCSGPTVDA